MTPPGVTAQGQHPHRLGPRPLPLHLAAAASTWMSAPAASHLLKSGSLDWRPELASAARELKQNLQASDPKVFDQAIQGEVRRRLYDFINGILAYRQHPYRRSLADPPAVWEQGSIRLLDYGATHPRPAGPMARPGSRSWSSHRSSIAPISSICRHAKA